MAEIRRIAVAAERSSAYGRNFIRGVAEVAERHPEWDLTLVDPSQAAAKATKGGYDGWICRVADNRAAKALARCGRPVVDCLCAREEPRFATVKTDAEAIGRLAADHLLKRHFSNFAYCGYRRVAFSDRRRDAFATLLERRNIRPKIYRPPLRQTTRFGSDFLLGDRVESPPDAADLADWLKRLPKPIGIFCCDDLRAFHLSMACRTAGLSIPDDVSILGVDDDPIYCMFSAPRLSSIDPDSVMIGRIAADTMAAMLSGATPPSIVVPPKGVVERASTNSYPDTPPWLAGALGYIRANAAAGISAQDVFRHVGFSRTRVERAFREATSSTVQGWIVAARVDEARRLLAATTLPIKEIAALSGFSSPEYFSRAFASATGLAPAVWRESNT